MDSFLLKEDGDNLLKEDGDDLLLDAPSFVPTPRPENAAGMLVLGGGID